MIGCRTNIHSMLICRIKSSQRWSSDPTRGISQHLLLKHMGLVATMKWLWTISCIQKNCMFDKHQNLIWSAVEQCFFFYRKQAWKNKFDPCNRLFWSGHYMFFTRWYHGTYTSMIDFYFIALQLFEKSFPRLEMSVGQQDQKIDLNNFQMLVT